MNNADHSLFKGISWPGKTNEFVVVYFPCTQFDITSDVQVLDTYKYVPTMLLMIAVLRHVLDIAIQARNVALG